jgi:hypothetical protein
VLLSRASCPEPLGEPHGDQRDLGALQRTALDLDPRRHAGPDETPGVVGDQRAFRSLDELEARHADPGPLVKAAHRNRVGRLVPRMQQVERQGRHVGTTVTEPWSLEPEA